MTMTTAKTTTAPAAPDNNDEPEDRVPAFKVGEHT